MDPRLQRRVQRYGWDRAVDAYARHWRGPLAHVQARLLALAAPAAGERVLDVACGTGDLALGAAVAVGPQGAVLGVDLSGAMVQAAQARAEGLGPSLGRAEFRPMDAESLDLPGASFDLVTCSLGLMYVPDPAAAVREMRRVLRPGGRVALAVWGERAHCGWAGLFPIVDDEVRSEVCPLFFGLGAGDALASVCTGAGLELAAVQRSRQELAFASAQDACAAAFEGGPVALAWSRFTAPVCERVRERYLASIEPWRVGTGYRIPAEFVLVSALVPAGA